MNSQLYCQPCFPGKDSDKKKHDVLCFICQEELVHGKHSVYSPLHIEVGETPIFCLSCRVCHDCLNLVRNQNTRWACGRNGVFHWTRINILLDKSTPEPMKCPDCNALCIDVQKHQETKCRKSSRFCYGCKNWISSIDRSSHNKCFIRCMYCFDWTKNIDLSHNSNPLDDLYIHSKSCIYLDTTDCPSCNISCRNKSALETHIKNNINCAPKTCLDCNILFDSGYLYNKHNRSRVCQLCNKNGDGCSMKHKKSGMCTYSCSKCHVSGIQTSEKQIHDENFCNRNFTFTCDVCEKNDILWKSRFTHTLRCNKNFPKISQLSVSTSISRWTCLFNPKIIPKKNDYKKILINLSDLEI